MGTNPASIAAQANYIGQLLNHVNRYTGVAIKDEPAILFVEMINEPVHHPEDPRGSVATSMRWSTPCAHRQQADYLLQCVAGFAIAPAIQRSKVDGVSFGWYPTGLVAGHTLHGNFLQAVDGYPGMLLPYSRASRGSCTNSTGGSSSAATCIRPWREPFAPSARNSRPCSPTTCCRRRRSIWAGRPTTSISCIRRERP